MYRLVGIAVLTLVALAYVIPAINGGRPAWMPFGPDQRFRLGLDLQGGTHLVMTVEADKAVENSVELLSEDLRRELKTANLRPKSVQRQGEAIEVTVPNDSADKLRDLIKDKFSTLQVIESEVRDGDAVLKMGLAKGEADQIRHSAVDQSLETIRNRIDQFGVSEPIIQRQGDRDILVQLPGIQDPARAKELIGKTAVLQFKLVREGVNPEEYVDGKKPLPAGTQLLYDVTKDETGKRRRGRPYVVESRVLMTGDVLNNASVRPGELPNSRVVLMSFDQRGGRQFEEITGANVQRRLAIVLDETVYSAPQIRERIAGGSAQIEGSFTPEEAQDLKIILRAGALPAPVTVAEERTVGPSLGRDSIRQGVISFAVAGSLVIVFMIGYYRVAGVLADMALVLNILYLLAALAAMGATLTLPGIAGMVLTMGMAVDSNVLINERLREELRAGKSARAAIDAAYARALPAILDTHVTTFLSGLILFQFGSGPIKGFAVTLCLGLVTSVFTAVVGTRVVYDYQLAHRQLQTVSV